MDEVRVIYRKYDNSLHWNHGAVRLGEDRHGTWLGAPAGTRMWRGVPEQAPWAVAFVLLIPHDRWWTANFNDAPHRTEIYCDITTVPMWPRSDEVTMIDLDLDVRRRRDGGVEMLDEHEFAAHRTRFNYPAEVVTAARSAADWLYGAVRDRVEPFGVGYTEWLARVG